MTQTKSADKWSADDFLFVPLGGSGEIGMNLNLYHYADKWLMVDCGVTFGDDTVQGIDVVMPDPAFIAERRASLVGLVLTHAHEDHLGAVQHLWPRFRCPIYATPFTAALLRTKLLETGLQDEVEVIEIEMSSRHDIGPFNLELVTLTHSIPEPNAVVIRTAAGTVLHTGDWKLDPEPLVGETTDEAALRRVGEEGVLALIGDSTNALVEGESGSEAAVRESLMELVGRFKSRVAVTCFASNVARVGTIGEVARAHGREVVLVGRSLRRITTAAKQTGYLADFPPMLSEAEAGYLPNDKVLMICTGSQGEPRSALARIARDAHPHIVLEPDDAVIFSSRIIPGNEKSISRLQNQLLNRGVEVITEDDHFVHVSGHPARDELIQMYQWIRPQIAVPVHGEYRHMLGHAELAAACQVVHTPVIGNGDVLRLSADGPEVLDQVTHGRLAVDGTRVIPLEAEDIRHRQRMLWNGSVVLTLVIGRNGGLMADPQLSAPGVIGDENDPLGDEVVDEVLDAIEDMPLADRRDDAAVAELARRTVRRFVRTHRGKNPHTEVHLVRI